MCIGKGHLCQCRRCVGLGQCNMSCPTAIRILRLAWNRLTFALGPTFAMGAPPPIHFLPARDLGDRAGLKFWDTWLLPSFRALRVLETRSFKYYKVPSLAQLKYCKMCTFYNQMCLSWIWVAVWVPSVITQMHAKHIRFHILLCMSVVWVAVWVPSVITQVLAKHMCFHIFLCMSVIWVAVWVPSVVTQTLAKHMCFHILLCKSVVWVAVWVTETY